MALQQQAGTATRTIWQMDPNQTVVEFSVKHLITTVRGRFNILRGTIRFDEANRSLSSVEVELDAASLDTGIKARDFHLKTLQFLNVRKYPLIQFKSVRIEPLDETHGRIIGSLAAHGVTHPVTLDAELTGYEANDETIHFRGSTRIKRSDFGVTLGRVLETGEIIVSNTMDITLVVTAHKLYHPVESLGTRLFTPPA